MDPVISFCRTPDGAQIAYTTMGDGPVLIRTPASFDTIETVLAHSDEHFWTALTSHFTVVSYDRRGTGMSTRDRADFSHAVDIEDLLTVTDAVGAREFDLLSAFQLTTASVQLAVDHPHRLRRLVLVLLLRARRSTRLPRDPRDADPDDARKLENRPAHHDRPLPAR